MLQINLLTWTLHLSLFMLAYRNLWRPWRGRISFLGKRLSLPLERTLLHGVASYLESRSGCKEFSVSLGAVSRLAYCIVWNEKHFRLAREQLQSWTTSIIGSLFRGTYIHEHRDLFTERLVWGRTEVPFVVWFPKQCLFGYSSVTIHLGQTFVPFTYHFYQLHSRELDASSICIFCLYIHTYIRKQMKRIQ
jgi:hypothetical protein